MKIKNYDKPFNFFVVFFSFLCFFFWQVFCLFFFKNFIQNETLTQAIKILLWIYLGQKILKNW